MNRFEFEVTVTPNEIDQLGHANNIEYLRWIQDAAIRHSDNVGLDWSAYRAIGGAFLIRRHTIDYLHAALLGETLRITTWIESHTRVTALRRTEIHNARGELVVKAETTWVFIELESHRPRRIPEVVEKAFTQER